MERTDGRTEDIAVQLKRKRRTRPIISPSLTPPFFSLAAAAAAAWVRACVRACGLTLAGFPAATRNRARRERERVRIAVYVVQDEWANLAYAQAGVGPPAISRGEPSRSMAITSAYGRWRLHERRVPPYCHQQQQSAELAREQINQTCTPRRRHVKSFCLLL